LGTRVPENSLGDTSFRDVPSYHLLRHNDEDVSMQGHCVYGMIHFDDQGSQNIRTGTHRFRTFHHPMDQSFKLDYFSLLINSTEILIIAVFCIDFQNNKLLLFTKN